MILTVGTATAWLILKTRPSRYLLLLPAKNALDDIDAAFTKRRPVSRSSASYDATSALVKQIEGGAPAEPCWCPPTPYWMDYSFSKQAI